MSISLVQRVEHWSQVAPDSVAHESGERAITYRELHERSCALAGHLNSTIGKDRSPIAIVGHKEPELLIGFIACARAGHPYIPIDRSTPPDRTQRILETAGPRLVLDPESIREHALSSESPPEGDVDELDPYYVIFTSGSTGDPKGVVITHGCLSTFIEWMMSDFEWNVGAERILNQAPFSFDLSVMDLSIALATSSTLVSVTADQIGNPKLLFQVLEKSDLTIWVSTPSFAQMCLTERGFSASMIPRLRRFLFCGETLANDVAAELLRRFPDAEVWNTYGPTEATVAVTSVRVTSELLAQHPVLPVGRPMPATRLLIHDEHGLSVHPGERGEIVIAGPSVSIGYLGAPELTERSFTRIDGQRAYRTGDWGRLQDGMLFFDGRRDGQIKLHGYRIELGDIEANLRQLEDVRDAAVLPVEHDGQVDSLTAFVVATAPVVESSFRASRAIQTALSSRLPAYMVPRRIRFLDSLPMTANGKADRARLKELLQ